MGGTTKRRGNQIFKVHWGEAKGGGGDYDFWLKFSGEENLGGNYVYRECPFALSVHMCIFKENQHAANKFCITGRDNLVFICMHLY